MQTSLVQVLVSVRETTGMPLSEFAMVHLYSEVKLYNMTTGTGEGATASFSNVAPGDYLVEVKCQGYKTSNERITVMGGGGSATFFVYMPTESEASSNVSAGSPVMSPKLQGLVEKGLGKMRKQEYAEALKVFEKALQLAPANPDVHYLLGTAHYSLKEVDEARKDFSAALQILPSHERSLLALGELELRSGNTQTAIDTLEKTFQSNGADWRVQLLLANAYFQLKAFDKAGPYASKTVELTKGKNLGARLLNAKILAATGRLDEARKYVEDAKKDFPNDSSIAPALEELTALAPKTESESTAQPETKAISRFEMLASMPRLISLVPEASKAWSPPDIDSKEYRLVSDVACHQPEVLAKSQNRMKSQMDNFEKFGATEQVVHRNVNAYGVPNDVREKTFNYLVTLLHGVDGITYLDESRDGGQNIDQFPTSLVTIGLVSMGVALLDRNYEQDFAYSCEGLTNWKGKAAWEMRFEQKKDVRARVLSWKNLRGTYPIPLRGRLWIAANTYELLHMETDLREPLPALELSLDHVAIDYGPVHFEKVNRNLWLPFHADSYMQFRGKRYHHTHTLSDYVLFSVDTQHKTSPPPKIPEAAQEDDAKSLQN